MGLLVKVGANSYSLYFLIIFVSNAKPQLAWRKEIMRRPLLAFIGIGVILALTSCQSISYKPSLSLGESPRTIGARVKIETFVDDSPVQDKAKKAGGTSATAPGTLQGNLGTEVASAVLTDFRDNQVFEVIKKKIEDPDLILKGRILRFYGKAGPNTTFWISLPIYYIIWWFGVPVLSDEGMVDLEISIHRSDGTLLGKYSAKSEFSASYSIYNNPTFGIGTRLNHAFSECISKIRQQILADESKFSRGANM